MLTTALQPNGMNDHGAEGLRVAGVVEHLRRLPLKGAASMRGKRESGPAITTDHKASGTARLDMSETGCRP